MDNSPAGINVFRSARGLIEAWSFAGPLVGVVHPLLLLLWSMGFVFGYRSVSSFTKQPLSFVFGCLPSPLAAHAPQSPSILKYSNRECLLSIPNVPMCILARTIFIPSLLLGRIIVVQRNGCQTIWSTPSAINKGLHVTPGQNVVLWRSSIVVTRPDKPHKLSRNSQPYHQRRHSLFGAFVAGCSSLPQLRTLAKIG